MAGTPALEVKSFPDVFQYISVICRTDGSGNVANNQILHYCEQETVVDAAFIRMAVGDDDATFTLEKCTDGTATASGTDMSAALTHATSLNNKKSTFALIATENIVPADSAITLKVTGTSTATTVMVTLRIRTRVA
ncbi:MAG: hypothetical protein CMH52_06360 [Myxococcales bacterium]|nr:hypothetical protein [Myxococcales bacterium]|tara:strand:- start:2978 stop:3385 length:408 start_codon:yes stop_codon:yes gene_type:complete